MHAPKEVVDTEVGHEEDEEAEHDVEVIVEGALEPCDGDAVECDGVDHERDEGPSLLGVPWPIGAPRDVCPNGSDEDAKAEGDDGRIKKELRKMLHLVGPAGNDECDDTTDEGEREEGEGQHDDADVDGQQGWTEHGHELANLWIHLWNVTDEEKDIFII